MPPAAAESTARAAPEPASYSAETAAVTVPEIAAAAAAAVAAAAPKDVGNLLPSILDASLMDEYFGNELLLPHATELVQHVRRGCSLLRKPSSSPNDPSSASIVNSSAIARVLVRSLLIWFGLSSPFSLNTPATSAVNLAVRSSRTVGNGVSKGWRNETMSDLYRLYSRWIAYAFWLIALPFGYDVAQRWWWRWQETERQRRLSGEHDRETVQQWLARERRMKTLDVLFSVIRRLVPMTKLVLLLRCWRSFGTKDETGPSPQVAMVLSGLVFAKSNHHGNPTLRPPSDQRTPPFVLYEYRRWLQTELSRLGPMLAMPIWNSVQETRKVFLHLFQRFLLPIWNRQIVENVRNCLPTALRTGKETESQTKGCPMCHADPIRIPFRPNGCGHAYCYTCLWSHVHNPSNSTPECIVCRTRIRSCCVVDTSKFKRGG